MKIISTYQRKAFLTLTFAWLVYSQTLAAVIYVNHAAVGANNGTSWANAFTNLSSALSSAANGDEIWVATGVYKPTIQFDFNSSGGSDAREVTFQIPSGVMLYGGFNGTELNRDERNWELNVTILSGDIDNNDINVDGNNIAEDTDDLVGGNAYHVIFTQNASISTIVDGFVITAGSASMATMNVSDPNLDGGGWFNSLVLPSNSSSPYINNSIFQGNYAESEGGAFFSVPGATGGTVTSHIENSEFINNKSNFSGGAIQLGSFAAGNYQPAIIACEFSGNEAYRRGGAIYFIGDHATVENSTFSTNRVTVISPDGSTRPGSGGAVSLTASNAQFSRCFFTENSATGNPTGAFEGGGGGAVYISTNDPQTTTLGPSEPKFINCGFYANTASGNTAAWGGAVVHLSDAGILRPLYVGCVFTDNQAQNHGGAIANFTRVISPPEGFTPAIEPTITNCTFTENHAGQFGGALYHDGWELMGVEILIATLQNSILWNNTATSSGPQIYNQGSIVNISYSLVAGSGGSGGGWNASLGVDGGNNIDDNPDFVNGAVPKGADNLPATNDDGLRLGTLSPAIDNGNNAASGLIGITTDYLGNARVQGGQVDMGAYERAGIIIPDLDLFWLYDWRPIPPVCLTCPWAVLLADPVIRNFRWEGPAQLIMDENNTIVTGTIVNAQNKNIAFEVYLKLSKPMDWSSWSAQRRTYIAITPEALKAAYLTHKKWSYFELTSESYLIGKGDVTGKLQLRHWPANYLTGFQLGTGANGWDGDLGLGGFFEYRGSIVVKGKKYSLKGIGSLNADAEKCLRDCEPLIDLDQQIMQEESVMATLSETEPKIYPNPATEFVTIRTNQIEGSYMVKLVDDTGQLRQQRQLEASDGSITLPLSGQQPGIYHLVVMSSQGEVQNHKIIIK